LSVEPRELAKLWKAWDSSALKRGNPNADRIYPTESTTRAFIDAQIVVAAELGISHMDLHRYLVAARRETGLYTAAVEKVLDEARQA